MKFVKDKHKLLLILFFLVYVGYFVTTSFFRYSNFHTGKFDLGNMDQTVWNTIHGRIFQMSTEDGLVISRLTQHADIILVLISPFYLLWSDPRMLLLIQTLVLASGVFLIYAISNHILKNKNLSLAFSFSYLINPVIERTNLYDFHAVTLATTFLLATFYFYLKKDYKLFVLFAILSAICKEQLWAVISIFGLFILFKDRKKMLGTIIFISSAIVFYFFIWYLIPKIAGGQHFALSYYSEYGDTPTKVIFGILLSPEKLVSTLLSADRISYLIKLFVPQGFLSLLSPIYLLFSIPDLVINLLSSRELLRELYYHYTAAISPFLFISSIYSINFLQIKFKNIRPGIFFIYIVFFSVLGAYLYGPLPGAVEQDVDMFTNKIPDQQFINDYLSKIPDKYTIAATNNIGSHISERQKVVVIPSPFTERADYVIFLRPVTEEKPDLKKIRNNVNYRLIIEKGNFLVFKKI